MQITLASALKEKNRIVGEIAKLWNLVQEENSCLELHKRIIDVAESVRRIEVLTEKLVELKTKIGKANEGNLQNMYALEECRNKLAQFARMDGSEDAEREWQNGQLITIERTAVFNEQQLLEIRNQLQKEANALQDKLDAYNAVTTIDFKSPL